MRIAIAHEWISARAGSEKVFEQLAGLYPEAELFALTISPGVDLDVGDRVIETTFLNDLGALRDRRAVILPVMPAAWRLVGRHNEPYDLVISSSHACVKGFSPGRESNHLCYVHAPMRYAWNPEIDSRGKSGGALGSAMRSALRRWDLSSTKWVNSFAANSSAVADRIAKSYNREARVIHPPVDTDFFNSVVDGQRDGLVSLGRLIPYKGHDLAIQVAANLRQPLTIIGRGPEEGRLRHLASKFNADVRFSTSADDAEVRRVLGNSKALLFCANEDFGIVPVEAQAAGLPVVGPKLGGLVDTVMDGSTGVLSDHFTSDGLTVATEGALALRRPQALCRQNAANFSRGVFDQAVRSWVADSS